MNKLMFLVLFGMVSCGERDVAISGLAGGPGADGSSCHVEQLPAGATIVCDDGSSALINDGAQGTPGADGLAGNNGVDGVGCSVQSVSPGGPAPNGGALVTCGATSTLVLNGSNGLDGAQGEQGETGEAGADGQNGADAPPTAFTITELIDPCGDAPGVYDEVLLQLANGTIIASFSANQSGLNTRLSVVGPGNFMTTDGTNCHFTVHSDLSVTW